MKKLGLFQYGLIFGLIGYPMWVFASHWQASPGYIPPHAFQVGHESNGKPLYLCRVRIFGSLQAGKTWRGYDRCNVPYGGKEYIKANYSLFLWRGQKGHWQVFSGHMPRRALEVGRDSDGKRLYLCQAPFNGGMQPGKTWRGYGKCNISFAGHEVIRSRFKVFVTGSKKGNPPKPSNAQRQCIKNAFGDVACGYHCVKSMNKIACASSPKEYCLSNRFGDVACGFNCISGPTKVRCAKRKRDVCVKNAFGEIRCGRYCRVDGFNTIRCDKP